MSVSRDPEANTGVAHAAFHLPYCVVCIKKTGVPALGPFPSKICRPSLRLLGVPAWDVSTWSEKQSRGSGFSR